MSTSTPSNATFHAGRYPKPSAAIKGLPVVIRDRIPHVAMPVEHDEACTALAACLTIDEGVFWANKADALAAWAKIYKSDEAAIAALRSRPAREVAAGIGPREVKQARELVIELIDWLDAFEQALPK